MKSSFKLGTVLMGSLFMVACNGDDRQAATPMTEDTIAAERPAMETPAAAQQVALEAIGGSGVTGDVHATPRDGSTNIMVMLRGAPANENIGIRVHSGTCESPGPELARIDAVSTDGMGSGHAETNVGHAPHLILDGNHIVAVYAPGAQPERDRPISCATLPEHAGARAGTTGGY
jgi:hypothetical protein